MQENNNTKHVEEPKTLTPKDDRPLDFWVDMHLPENKQKIVNFAEELAIEGGGETWILDAVIMLSEAFKNAGEDDSLNTADLAADVQAECFKLTREFEAAQHAYVDYLSKGVRDYRHESNDQSDWEYSKVLMHMAGYLAQEPNRIKTMKEEMQAERAAEKEIATSKAVPPVPDLDPAEKISILRRMSADFAKSAEEIEGDSATADNLKAAGSLVDFLSNPRCPATLYNVIVDELTDFQQIDSEYDTAKFAGILERIWRDENKEASDEETA